MKAIGELLVGPDAGREAPATSLRADDACAPGRKQPDNRFLQLRINRVSQCRPPGFPVKKPAPASKPTTARPAADPQLKSSAVPFGEAVGTASPRDLRSGLSRRPPRRSQVRRFRALANPFPTSWSRFVLCDRRSGKRVGSVLRDNTSPDPETVTVPQPAKIATLRDEIQDELDSIDARNSGFLDTGTTVRARSGENGFDHLIVEQAELEASYVIGNAVRVSVIAQPTFLDAGTPTGISTRRFGLLPVGGTFTDQSVGGVGGEVQLSTDTLGVRAGVTPDSFLVRNVTGGFRFRPGHGPITFLAERDTVKDSLLSYAGSRDPVTNKIWGGVVANTFSALGNWGGEKTGFYGGVGFQTITGTNVESNNRLDGNVGMYWRVMDLRDSTLTVGFNLSALHYEYNLSGFTLGQGGYFSPQQYFLTSVPVPVEGRVQDQGAIRAERGALGVQHFEEDSSPFFPTMPAIQGKNGPYTVSQTVTGANYSLDLRAAVQLTPHWYAGIWANVNNTRNYTAETLALYIRYTFARRPLTQNSIMPSIPDWKGVEPFRLP